ncbi:protein jag [bacterium]|nr:MAG: protein jag [bacterium]
MADKKFSPMRYSASTEEAAIAGALQIVGVSRDEIEIEVLDKTEKGVTVRIKPRSSDTPAPAPAPVEEPVAPAPVVEETAVEEIEEPSPIVEDVPELLAQDEEPEHEAAFEEEEVEVEEAEDEPSEADESETEESETEEATEVEGAEAEAEEAPEYEAPAPLPLVEQDPIVVERARVQAQDFLDRMGLEATAGPGTTTDAGTVAIVIEGDDVGILIGKHGSTLQSFQYLLNLTLNAQHEGEGTRVIVDAGNYRARRQSSLEQTARSAASKARREGRAIRLEPMPAHERRLVHMFLQTEADIATQSEGREPMRRIVVAPASGGRLASPPRSGRSSGGERSYGENRGSSSGGAGMGGYRRGDANSERNRGYRGR